ncbi:MAG: M20/M25/M40 family metallo-hydrolase [Bullifex sp.]
MDRYDYFRKLVSIPSPSRHEDEMRDYISSVLIPLGYGFRMDEAGNMVFFREDSKATLCLAAHMDTVAPAVNANMIEDDERFFTDGTTALGADDKCAIAMMLELAEEGFNAVLLFFSAEEIGLWGSAHMDPHLLDGLGIECVYVIDAQGDVGGVIREAVGKSRLTISVKGKAAHAGFAPEKGISALTCLADIVMKIPQGHPDEISTCSVGSFICEGSTNVVPDKAEAVLEVRSLSDDNREEIIESIMACAKERSSAYGAIVTFTHERLYSHYAHSENDPYILKITKALEKAGANVNVKSTTGGSDGNNLNSIGIKAVVLTSGYYNAHGNSEYLDKRQFDILSSALRNLLSEKTV